MSQSRRTVAFDGRRHPWRPLYRALLSADNVVVGRKSRRGREIPRWVIVPSVFGFGGRTRMAGQPEFGPHPHRSLSQHSRVVYAAAIAAAVFVVVTSLVWLGVWLLTRVV